MTRTTTIARTLAALRGHDNLQGVCFHGPYGTAQDTLLVRDDHASFWISARKASAFLASPVKAEDPWVWYQDLVWGAEAIPDPSAIADAIADGMAEVPEDLAW